MRACWCWGVIMRSESSVGARARRLHARAIHALWRGVAAHTRCTPSHYVALHGTSLSHAWRCRRAQWGMHNATLGLTAWHAQCCTSSSAHHPSRTNNNAMPIRSKGRVCPPRHAHRTPQQCWPLGVPTRAAIVARAHIYAPGTPWWRLVHALTLCASYGSCADGVAARVDARTLVIRHAHARGMPHRDMRSLSCICICRATRRGSWTRNGDISARTQCAAARTWCSVCVRSARP